MPVLYRPTRDMCVAAFEGVEFKPDYNGNAAVIKSFSFIPNYSNFNNGSPRYVKCGLEKTGKRLCFLYYIPYPRSKHDIRYPRTYLSNHDNA